MTLRWRTLEWLGCGIALFLLTGALLPLLMMGGGEGLDDAARARLRLLMLPVYLITAVLLSRHLGQLMVAVRRSLPLTLLLALPLLSVTWSISPSISLRRAVGLILSIALAYLLAIRFTPRQLLLLVAAVLVPCMVLSLVFAVALPGLGRMPLDAGIRGVYVHKNVLGWYAAIAVLVTGISVLQGDPLPRRVALLPLAVSVACLLASGSVTSLGAAVAIIVITCFYLTLKWLQGTARSLMVLVSLQLAALLLIGLGELLVPLLEFLGRDATLTGRVPLWQLVDEAIGRHLLLGVGYQAFWTEANPEAWHIWGVIRWGAPHSHNGYREILLNFGIVGFAAFVLMIVRALRQGAALYCAPREDGWLWLNVLVGMFLLMNLTESLFLVQNEFLFVLFSTAILMFSLRAPELRRHAASHAAGPRAMPLGAAR